MPSTPRRSAGSLLLFAVLVGALTNCASAATIGAAGASTSATARPSQAVDAFVEAASWLMYDYEPFDTVADLAAQADVVVEGEIEGVASGRSYASTPGGELHYVTSVLAVRVSGVLQGDASLVHDGRVYVEIVHPAFVGTPPTGEEEESDVAMMPFDHATFARTVPIGLRGIYFLSDLTEASDPQLIEDEGAGRPDGAPITGTHVQGFLIEPSGGGLISVMEPLDSMPSAWRHLGSLDDVRDALTSQT